jgi:hypothetical protein
MFREDLSGWRYRLFIIQFFNSLEDFMLRKDVRSL